MLAVLAFLVIQSAGPIPNAFLSADLTPRLPVRALLGRPRYSVTRGSNWRKGGLVRLNFYYVFPKGQGPDIKAILREEGFVEQALGNTSELGAGRMVNGMRQVVAVSDLEPGQHVKWAKVTGPARLITVSEFPLMDEVPIDWHQDPVLQQPPLPPSFPPPYSFIRGHEVHTVSSQPLIPRGFRSNFWTHVFVNVPGTPTSVIDQIQRDLPPHEWQFKLSNDIMRAHRLDRSAGLISIEVVPHPERNPTEIRLNYCFEDPENRPRIID